MNKPIRWFSHVRPDGDLSGNYICEKCTPAYMDTHPNGYDEILNPDPMKTCVCCNRRVAMPKTSIDLGKFSSKKNKREWSLKI